MSRNAKEWLFVLTLAAAFIGYCNYNAWKKSDPARFHQQLIGTWLSTAQANDGQTVPAMLQFKQDGSYLVTIANQHGTGSWQLIDDPAIEAREFVRILRLNGDIHGDYPTIFLDDTLRSALSFIEGQDNCDWQRVP